ncbi:hypothetical protein L249_7052, partial [Ophiocordyceps polyrhachis-furcata BCC 54312]
GTRPEGLGGSRDAGPAAAGPRPPYVTEAVRYSGCTRRLRHGYAVQRLRPYGPYGPYEGRNGGFPGSVTMLRYSFALRSRLGLQRQQQQQRQQRQQAQKDYLITGCQEGGRTRGPRQQTSRPSSSSSSFLRQGSQRLNPRSFFSTSADTATATANALVAIVPLLLLLSLSNALFGPIFSAAFFVLWSSVLFFPPSSSYGRPYDLQRRQEQGQDQDQDQDQERDRQQNTGTSREQQSQQIQQEQRQQTNVPTAVPYLRPPQSLPSSSYSSSSSSLPGRGIQQFLDQFEERVLDRRVDWLPFFTALLRYYGAFDQIRTVGYRDKLRRHEARRPKIKDTIDWLEKHAFFCRKIGSSYGPGPGSDRLLRRTRPEGLGGSRDAGPAAAGPRPPYVTEAVRHSGCGYGTATPYSGYGRTGRTGRTKEGT